MVGLFHFRYLCWMNWTDVLEPIKNSDYYKILWQKVEEQYHTEQCFPPKDQIFKALELTDFDDVKVVIIGQDPYHNLGQANGLCFSVTEGIKAPPSLKNIFKELESDLGIIRTKTELEDWGSQGVLLLNATLSVKAHEPNSHKDIGWEVFTDFIIKEISDRKENVVFVLWGAFAQKKEELIDSAQHFILKSPHPSPFSARKGFFGSQPFSQINDFLKTKGKSTINW